MQREHLLGPARPYERLPPAPLRYNNSRERVRGADISPKSASPCAGGGFVTDRFEEKKPPEEPGLSVSSKRDNAALRSVFEREAQPECGTPAGVLRGFFTDADDIDDAINAVRLLRRWIAPFAQSDPRDHCPHGRQLKLRAISRPWSTTRALGFVRCKSDADCP